jgi:predicted transport protein
LADIRLFQLQAGSVHELAAHTMDIEKSLQNLLETHLQEFLGVRFLASEYVTGKKHGGRIDTLGLDDNHCPVIIEYKRALNENVINQGLYYLDWLMDHQGEFKLQVMEKLGPESAGKIDWTGPRLLCIAGDFTKYDEYAVMQIPRSVELLRYRRYGADLLLLELVNSGAAVQSKHTKAVNPLQGKDGPGQTSEAPAPLAELWESLQGFLLALGDDVTMKPLEYYTAFRRMKNFACVKIMKSELLVWAKVDPKTVDLEEHFTKYVTNLGHLGTGNLEIRIENARALEKAKPLLLRSYQEA